MKDTKSKYVPTWPPTNLGLSEETLALVIGAQHKTLREMNAEELRATRELWAAAEVDALKRQAVEIGVESETLEAVRRLAEQDPEAYERLVRHAERLNIKPRHPVEL